MSTTIPSASERTTLLREMVPSLIASDQEIADMSAEFNGWNLGQIQRRVRSIYISILTFEGKQDREQFIPPQMADEDNTQAMIQFNAGIFGVCPECGYLGSYYLADGVHLLACERHRIKWNVSHFHAGEGFTSWQRHSAMAQALRPVELPDLSQYSEVVQPLPAPYLEQLTQLAIELRVIHHNQKLLDWLHTQDHDFNDPKRRGVIRSQV